MFILDRVTGKPVFGVEERAVPKGDVPGEWYSPTQPFPVKPLALERTRLAYADLVRAEDTTPEHAQACLELWAAKVDKMANAVPATFQGKNGRQYVAVTATDTLFVFGLP
jgi:glucose dehydrogenase